MTNWGNASTVSSGDTHPISVLLAGKVNDSRLLSWQQSVLMDARFRLAAVANDAADLQVKLSSSPEVVVLDAMVFDGPAQLIPSLTAINGAVYLILPTQISNNDELKGLPEELKTIPSVKMVYVGDANIPDLLTRAYGDALALRKTIAAPQAAWSGRPGGGAAVSGMRVVTVWNRAGGVGRTTIAAALAQAVSRRNIRTLLVNLDAPDVMPLHYGLKSDPNITGWFSNPTDSGLKAAIQTIGDLNVIAGFPDIMSEGLGEQSDDKNSVASLVTTAAYAGFAAIILDTPVAGIAPRTIAAANTWILVARPTLADAWASVEAFRTVTQRAAGQHRINPGNIFVVLNKRRQGMLSPDDWHRAADQASRKLGLQVSFPPIAAVIPDVSGVTLAQDAGRSFMDGSDEFARPVNSLVDMLFGGHAPSAASIKKNLVSIKFKK